ncbi:hypothetical protein T484DRAFT_1611312, partial [Baffinella frigidus]
TANRPQVALKYSSSRPQVDLNQTSNRPQIDPKSTVDLTQTSNRPEIKSIKYTSHISKRPQKRNSPGPWFQIPTHFR